MQKGKPVFSFILGISSLCMQVLADFGTEGYKLQNVEVSLAMFILCVWEDRNFKQQKVRTFLKMSILSCVSVLCLQCVSFLVKVYTW